MKVTEASGQVKRSMAAETSIDRSNLPPNVNRVNEDFSRCRRDPSRRNDMEIKPGFAILAGHLKLARLADCLPLCNEVQIICAEFCRHPFSCPGTLSG
jgi:hypothetical protein